MTGCTITYNTASGNGAGIYKIGPLTVSGTMVVKNNTKSYAANDLFIASTAGNKYVSIANAGLSCGSSIGIYKDHNFTNNIYTSIVGGSAANCLYAYRNRFFFDDQAVSTVCDMNDSPYYTPSGGSGWLYFIKNTSYQAAGASNTWYGHVDASGCTLDGSGYVTHISTPAGFAYFSQQINAGMDYSGKTVYLDNDLDLSAYNWEPIGYIADCDGNATPFKGTFDGQGHTISGLNTPFQYPNMGLFGYVEGGIITNTFVVSGTINTVNAYGANETKHLGGLVGLVNGGTISNSEAAVSMTGGSATVMGGLVGEATTGTIHSCSAMSVMTGYQMGGLVGTNGGSLQNSFANPSFTRSGGTLYIGGLVGVNTGTVSNCYVRQRGTAQSGNFGWTVGNNTGGTVSYCYIPDGQTAYIATGNAVSSCGQYTAPVAPYLYNHSGNNVVGSSSLVGLLNAQRGTGAEWKRTTAGGYSTGAGNINGDFPVHKYTDYNCVASTDGIVLDYHTNLDNMLTRHATNATVNLYVNDNTSKGTGTGVVLYIDEDISLLQSTGNSIEAYTCQTLKTSSGSRCWHTVSSSLSNSTIGFNYGTSAQVPFSWAENPCNVTFGTDNDHALFPSDVPDVNKVDLYTFYEPEYHWINLKRNSASHWHMDAPTVPITYNNETDLVVGRGYLVSIEQEQLLQNRGTLNNGPVGIGVSKTDANEWAGLLGYNLIGNPYQSFLDFTEFASVNSSLWTGKSSSERTYAVYDPSSVAFLQYKEGTSRGAKAASGYINPHQGFLIRVTTTSTTANFTNTMRSNDGTPNFRDDQPAYPLLNLTVTDADGDADVAVLELGRDADEGAEKLRSNTCKGWLYLHHHDDDYAILFRRAVEGYQPLWFEASEAGTYTLSWEAVNVEFESLTLVDNITGIEIDMLERDSYVFEAMPEQFASRFKIVVGDWKDVDEYGDGSSASCGAFAFVSGGSLVVNGEGRLEVVDVTGRVLATRELSGAQSVIGKPVAAAGVYLLRLTGKSGTKVQKIVMD